MIIAKKLGMTRIYDEKGKVYATTLLQVTGKIISHKTIDKHGYSANVIVYGNKKRFNKPQKYIEEKFETIGKIKELRVQNESDLLQIGSNLSLSTFQVNKKVNVRSKSKGKGYAGTMKRHNFGGGNASHGASKSHRSAGSTGQCQDPGKVFKGKKMAGHLGNEYVTTKRLTILRIDLDQNIICIHGSIPGPNNQYVEVRHAI